MKETVRIEQRAFNLWARIYQAPDVPGQWVAHCLDLDIVTQGDSAMHAREMLLDALEECIAADLIDGHDPRDVRPSASDEEWAELRRIVETGDKVNLPKLEAAEVAKLQFATSLRITVELEVVTREHAVRSEAPKLERHPHAPQPAGQLEVMVGLSAAA